MELLLGSLDVDRLSSAIDNFSFVSSTAENNITTAEEIAIPIFIKEGSYSKLKTLFTPISDEYMLQQFAINLGENEGVKQSV